MQQKVELIPTSAAMQPQSSTLSSWLSQLRRAAEFWGVIWGLAALDPEGVRDVETSKACTGHPAVPAPRRVPAQMVGLRSSARPGCHVPAGILLLEGFYGYIFYR